jgi:arylsulfatase A-like enzyme
LIRRALSGLDRRFLLPGALWVGAAIVVLWGASFILLAPDVFRQLELGAYLPFAIILPAAVLGSFLAFHRAWSVLGGVGSVAIVALVAAHAMGVTPTELKLRLDHQAPGTAYVLKLMTPTEIKVPTVQFTDGESAVCKPGQPSPHAENIGEVGEQAPDIILVTVDAMRWDHTPMSGYKRKTMPHLAERAETGAVFTDAYSTGSTTRQTFRSMFSGIYSSRIKAPKSTKWGVSFADEQETLASYLAAAGYHTVALSCDPGAFPEQYGAFRGFEVVDESPVAVRKKKRYSAPYKVNRIIAYLSDPEVDEPKFVWTHLLEAHQPYPSGPDPIDFGRGESDRYDEALHFVDGELKRLLDFALSPDRRRRTIVIITADHGQAFREHGFRYHGATVYGEETHVPWIIWGPEVKAGRYETPVSLIDLVPTVLDLLGLKVPEALCGESLESALRKGKEPDPRPVYIETLPDRTWDFFGVGLVQGDDKLVLRPNKEITQLFNLAEDPDEQKNLAKSRPKRLAEMLDALREFYEAHGLDPADYGI